MDLKTAINLIKYEERLQSFDKTWPYADNHNCSKMKMAEAGFYHLRDKVSPDLVQCNFCKKTLGNWEEEDDPMMEHASHADYCKFVKFYKQTRSTKLTVRNYSVLRRGVIEEQLSAEIEAIEKEIKNRKKLKNKKKIRVL